MDSLTQQLSNLFPPRMSKAAFATLCFIQCLYGKKITLLILGNDHLCYALAILNDKVFLTKINQNNTDFTAIIGIYNANLIGGCQSSFTGNSASRIDKSRIALGNFKRKKMGALYARP